MTELVSSHFRLNAVENNNTGTLTSVSTEQASNIRFTGSSPVSVEGFQNYVNDKLIFIHNQTGGFLELKNLTGTAEEQINTGVGSNYNLANNASLILIYSNTKWRPLAPLQTNSSVQTATVATASSHQFNLGAKSSFLYRKLILNVRKTTPRYYSSELLVSADHTDVSGFRYTEYGAIGGGIDFLLSLDATGSDLLLEISNLEALDSIYLTLSTVATS